MPFSIGCGQRNIKFLILDEQSAVHSARFCSIACSASASLSRDDHIYTSALAAAQFLKQ